jgi:methanogenic corrinoid protein MtbC1
MPNMSQAATARSAPPLSTVVYRSRAVSPLSAPELLQLTTTAQARNRRESITGLMLYDDRRFFQWLEGPADSVDRVMTSIRKDRRHTDIELLDDHAAPARTFGDWAMKLATPAPTVSLRGEALEPPAEIVEILRKRPEAAPALLLKLVPLSPDSIGGALADSTKAQLSPNTASVLRNVIVSAIIPKLVATHGARGPESALWPANPRANELADLLIAADQSAALELIQELKGADGEVQPLYATLFEPAARSLGDLWNEDSCSEFDVTLGLCRLQTAVRLLAGAALPPVSASVAQPLVLIAPEPGEMHGLGAAMDSEVLWNAGWAPHTEYPEDDKALQDLLAGNWFDVLDLSLSSAFRRDSWLPRMNKTIAAARLASRNPALVVAVGGRVFNEEKAAGISVGADMASKSALHVDRSILEAMRIAQAHAKLAAD